MKMMRRFQALSCHFHWYQIEISGCFWRASIPTTPPCISSLKSKDAKSQGEPNIKMPIRKVPQNGTSKWFCLLPHHDSWKVNLLVLEVCKLCGAHYNGLLVIFNRHFRRLWRTSWNIPKSITNCARSLSEKSVF